LRWFALSLFVAEVSFAVAAGIAVAAVVAGAFELDAVAVLAVEVVEGCALLAC
jgi:hypothetical protein